jgi:hypothetical protein
MKHEAPIGVMTKRLRATITIEIEATDYREAAVHQERLESHLTAVRSDYPDAQIALCERRGGPRPATNPSRTLHHRSGRLNSYE